MTPSVNKSLVSPYFCSHFLISPLELLQGHGEPRPAVIKPFHTIQRVLEEQNVSHCESDPIATSREIPSVGKPRRREIGISLGQIDSNYSETPAQAGASGHPGIVTAGTRPGIAEKEWLNGLDRGMEAARYLTGTTTLGWPNRTWRHSATCQADVDGDVDYEMARA